MRVFRRLALGASVLALALSACSTGGGGSDDQDRFRRIRRSSRRGRGLRPGPRGRGLHRRPRPASASAPARSPGRARERPDRPQARVHRQRPRRLRRRGDDRRRYEPRQRLQEKLTPLEASRSSTTRPARTRTRSSSARRRQTSSTSSKMSDLAAVQDQLKWGLATDCPTNPVCAKALKDAYGIDQPDASPCSPRAAARWPTRCSTRPSTSPSCARPSPEIIVNGWVLLEDDKQTQPADNIAPLVRNDLLADGRPGRVREDPQRRVGQDRHGHPGPALLRRRDRRQGPRRSSPGDWLQSVGARHAS